MPLGSADRASARPPQGRRAPARPSSHPPPPISPHREPYPSHDSHALDVRGSSGRDNRRRSRAATGCPGDRPTMCSLAPPDARAAPRPEHELRKMRRVNARASQGCDGGILYEHGRGNQVTRQVRKSCSQRVLESCPSDLGELRTYPTVAEQLLRESRNWSRIGTNSDVLSKSWPSLAKVDDLYCELGPTWSAALGSRGVTVGNALGATFPQLLRNSVLPSILKQRAQTCRCS